MYKVVYAYLARDLLCAVDTLYRARRTRYNIPICAYNIIIPLLQVLAISYNNIISAAARTVCFIRVILMNVRCIYIFSRFFAVQKWISVLHFCRRDNTGYTGVYCFFSIRFRILVD